MGKHYEGIPEEMLNYFVGISLNNYREYFHRTHQEYEKYVREPLLLLAETLTPDALYVDPDMEQRPGSVISHINRDLRFSKDKTPYRDYMFLKFRPASRSKWESHSLFYGISVESSSYGGDFYYHSHEEMLRARQLFVNQSEELLEILHDPEFSSRFRIFGENFKKLPVPENLPEELHDLYTKKYFYVEHNDPICEKVHSAQYAREIGDGFRVLKPFYEYMKQIL